MRHRRITATTILTDAEVHAVALKVRAALGSAFSGLAKSHGLELEEGIRFMPVTVIIDPPGDPFVRQGVAELVRRGSEGLHGAGHERVANGAFEYWLGPVDGHDELAICFMKFYDNIVVLGFVDER